MSEELALALVAVVAPFIVQLFRYILNRTGVNVSGIPALAFAAIVAIVLAFVATMASGEIEWTPEGAAVVFALAHVVYVALRGRLEEWMPTE
jgi:FtsH-binding integral membrane protein